MAQEFEGTGVITDITSSDSSVVSVTINSVLKEFFFSKSIFYVFGVKCEGSLDNVLESGMEVNVCYKFSANDKAYIRAVWLGNKPNSLRDDGTTMKAVYNQTGRVKHVSGDNIFVESDDSNRIVVINKLVLFRNGHLPDEKNGVTVAAGENVTFDAIPFDNEHDRYASYQATCAWIGGKNPRVADRFNLRIKEEEESEDEEYCDEDADGTVVVIPNDVIALIEVESEFVIGKVFLFRSSFSQRCERIQDMVAVGDTLKLRLRLGYLFPERKQWFVSRAWRHCVEIPANERGAKSRPLAKIDLALLGTIEETDVKDSKGTVLRGGIADEKRRSNEEVMPGSSESQDEKEVTVMPTAPPKVNIMESESTLKPSKFNSSSRVLMSNDPPLSGVIRRISSCEAYIIYENLHIYVNMNDIFIRGALCTAKQFHALVKSGENIVRFEAVRPRNNTPLRVMNSVVTHEAVRVWVGHKPSLHDVLSCMPSPDLSLVRSNRTFYGVISKLCLPKIAVVYVLQENMAVCLHVRMLQKSGHDSIGHCVMLGQYLKFKVMKVDSCPQMLCACDVELISEATYKAANETLIKSEKKETWIPFANVHSPSKKRTLLLNCKGTLTFSSSKSALKVQHNFGYSSLIIDPVLYGTNKDMPLSLEMSRGLNGHSIRFDAEIFEKPSMTEYFCVKRMWEINASRPSSERCLTAELSFGKSVKVLPTAVYAGKIQSIPLHDSAIAIVQGSPVLVPLESLVMKEKVNGSYVSIDEYLKEGDLVSLKIREEEALAGGKGLKYLKAIKCGRGSQTPDDHQKAGITDENPALSWDSVWGQREFFCKGRVKRFHNKYVVSFKSQYSGVNLNLDVFAKGKLLKDGVLWNQETVREIADEEITYHVAYSREVELADPSTFGMYIACAWIGTNPSPLALLKDKLCDSPRSVCPNWLYEAVVRDFPLPTHMLCTIGPIPVAVPLTQLQAGDKFVGVKEHGLTRGDLVTLRVLEGPFGDDTFLISNDLATQSDFAEVVTFCKGILLSLPNPVGIIELTNPNVTASFELCHIFTCAFEAAERNLKEMKTCIDKNKTMLDVGKEIYVTAVKTKGKFAAYRALRLWF